MALKLRTLEGSSGLHTNPGSGVGWAWEMTSEAKIHSGNFWKFDASAYKPGFHQFHELLSRLLLAVEHLVADQNDWQSAVTCAYAKSTFRFHQRFIIDAFT